MKCCFNCGSYNPYYTKGDDKFKREIIGYCSKHDTILAKYEDCQDWQDNTELKLIRKNACTKALNCALSDLAQIRQILIEEEQEQS